MDTETWFVVAFDSTHRALGAAALLDEGKVPYFTIPTPGEIHAGCGIALKCRPSELDAVRAAVEAGGAFGEGVTLWKTIGHGYTRCS